MPIHIHAGWEHAAVSAGSVPAEEPSAKILLALQQGYTIVTYNFTLSYKNLLLYVVNRINQQQDIAANEFYVRPFLGY